MSLIEYDLKGDVDNSWGKLAGYKYGIAISPDWVLEERRYYIIVAEKVRGDERVNCAVMFGFARV